MLDITSFEKALTTLAQALNAYKDAPTNDYIRDACIQRFEYCYELSHKMLKRYLEMTEPTTAVIDDMSFASLIRLGYERGLLSAEWSIWKGFRQARNMTSHTYDEHKASDVYQIIPSFLIEASFLLQEIKKRQEDLL